MSTLVTVSAAVVDKDVETFSIPIKTNLLGLAHGDFFWVEVRVHTSQPALHEPPGYQKGWQDPHLSPALNPNWAEEVERRREQRDFERMRKNAEQIVQEQTADSDSTRANLGHPYYRGATGGGQL